MSIDRATGILEDRILLYAVEASTFDERATTAQQPLARIYSEIANTYRIAMQRLSSKDPAACRSVDMLLATIADLQKMASTYDQTNRMMMMYRPTDTQNTDAQKPASVRR